MSCNNAAMLNLGQGCWECRRMGGTHWGYRCVKKKLGYPAQLSALKTVDGWEDRAKKAYWHNLIRKGRSSHGDDRFSNPLRPKPEVKLDRHRNRGLDFRRCNAYLHTLSCRCHPCPPQAFQLGRASFPGKHTLDLLTLSWWQNSTLPGS
jgi:hypothetical protein